mmetsp:Transcript_135465/g.191669  ORF Transcript_135465/g.191669 Transcript_135465/m.191669 type:complete len:102 (+) Transcript_135465:16-321(+)
MADPYRTPNLNTNVWHTTGPHRQPVSQKRVAIGVTALLGISTGLFLLSRAVLPRNSPGTLTKEWQQAQKRRHKERQMDAISNHKVGAPVTIYEPSITEEAD